jgi:hypothetical protein
MEQNFQNDQKELLLAQIRECYGRVAYSHKTHEKCADILLKRNNQIKLWQMILSAITTGSFIVTLVGDNKAAGIIGALISSALLILNSYTKNYELTKMAEEHKIAAASLWNVRESYLSLIVDMSIKPSNEVIERRDQLQVELASVYKCCPRTNMIGYTLAQVSLKQNEDLTFSDEEIDKLLPMNLRKNKTN